MSGVPGRRVAWFRAALTAVVVTAAGATSALAQQQVSILPGGVHVVDFNQFIGQRLETNGPIDLGSGVTWSAWSEAWVGDMAFGLRSNGYWNSGRMGFVGLNTHDSAMVFTFEEPVSAVGAFVNYAPLVGQGPIPTIEALDASGRIIDSLSLDIRTPNGVNDGGFLGFEHESNDIFTFRFRARYGVLDDLTWLRRDGRGIIPAPSALALLGGALLGCAPLCRRRP